MSTFTPTARNEIAFIDGRVSDIPTLLAGLPSGMEVHVLDASQDGLTQINTILAGRTGIDAIHVLGHGDSGSAQLGSSTLTSANLNQYQAQLAQLGSSLTADGDLLLYGCNVAQGDAGQAFVQQIAALTGADVAASTNLTGSAALGGDWVLEATSGQVESQTVEPLGYNGTLINGITITVDVAGVNGNGTVELPSGSGIYYVAVPHAAKATGTTTSLRVYLSSVAGYEYAVYMENGNDGVDHASAATDPSYVLVDVAGQTGTTFAYNLAKVDGTDTNIKIVVTQRVAPPNTAPTTGTAAASTANPDASNQVGFVIIGEGTTLSASNLNDTNTGSADTDGDTLTYAVTTPQTAAADIAMKGYYDLGVADYTVSDGTATPVAGTIRVYGNYADDAPTAGTGGAVTISAGTSMQASALNNANTGSSDPDSNSLNYALTGATVVAPSDASRPDYKGLTTLGTQTYSVSDGTTLVNGGSITVKANYIDDAPTGSVTATGTSKVSNTLTATNNISDVDDGGSGVSKSYVWQSFNTSNNTWEALGGATSSTFTPAAGDANKLVRVKITAGSPATDFYSDVRLIAPASGPATLDVSGLPTPITVKNPSGDTNVTNNNPNPSTTGVTLDGPGGGTTVTTGGNGPITVANPGSGGVTVNNTGTGVTTVTGVPAGDTVTPQGSGPIVIETAANPGITVNDVQPAADLTIKNTGSGTVNVTPVGADGTVKVAPGSTGAIALDNPAGSTTVTNNGSSSVTVNHLTDGSSVTSNGSGSGGVNVSSPAGNVTLTNNTNTSTLTTTGVGNGNTVTTDGTGPTAVANPTGNVTVNNTGTGTSTVTGTTNGSTVTAQGTGSVVVNSVLSSPNTITVDATGNQNHVTVDNDGTGAINVTNIANSGTVTSTGSGTGDTTVVTPTGNLTVANTGTNAVKVTGLDDGATLTTTGTGPTTVTSPDGSGTIHNTGSGTVTVTNVLDGKTFTTDSTGPTTFSNPAGDLTVNNTGSGTVTTSGLGDGKTITTNGDHPVGISNPVGNVTVVNTGTGLDTVTGLAADKIVTTTGSGNTTVSDPAGNVTLHNTGTGTLTATGVNTGATVNTTGTTVTSVSNPDGNVTVNNTGTGTSTVTGTTSGSTVTTQGTGPIVVNSVLTTPSAITVAATANTNITLDNDSTGTVTVTGVTTGATIKNTGSGSTGTTNVSNPTGTGTLTVENTGTNPLTVTGLDSGATLTNTANSNGSGGITVASPDSGTTTVNNLGSNTITVTGAPTGQTVNGASTSTGLTNVNDPLGNVTLNNAGSGELRVTGANNGTTVTTTGNTATTVQNPDNNVTVNNTGTGVATVNGAINGSTVTTQGIGPITVHSELTAGNGITVAAASNTHLTVDNDSTGSVTVTGVTNASTIHSTGSGTGTTTVANPTGNLTVDNTGSNVVTVTGFDNNKTLTTTGTGPITVADPDGNMFLSNTGTGAVTVSSINIGNTLTINSGSNGPINVASPDGNVNVINNSTQLVTVSSVHDGATVNCTGSGPQTIDLASLSSPNSVTIDNDGTGLVNLTHVPYGVTVYFTGTGPATVSSFSGNPVTGPAVLENLSTSLVTVANDASGVDTGTVKSSGTGPIKFDTDVTTGQTLHVNIADNTNVTFDNDGAGTLDVVGAPADSTLTSSSSGPMTVTNPTGNLTVNNTANGTLNVTGLDTNKTLTVSGNGNTTVTTPDGNLTLVNTGTGSMTVDAAITHAEITTASSQSTNVTNPAGDLVVHNSGSGTVSVSGLNNSATLAADGTGATHVTTPDANASFTVNNTGTGLVSVSDVANHQTVTTQGTGQIAISSALGLGESITVNATANNDIQITNTGAGQVNVPNNLALDTNDAMSFTLTGNHTTVMNLTGTLDLGNAPLTLNLASGYAPAIGDTITLIANDSNDAITGAFAGKAEGDTVVVGACAFTISYTGGTGNDVVLTMTEFIVTTELDDAVGADLAADVADGSGLSLREALHWSLDNGKIGFAAGLNGQTITLATNATVKAGITFDTDAVGTLTITGSTLALAGDLSVTNSTGDNLTIGSSIAGASGALIKEGVGTLTLSGTNSYSGTTVINAGTLVISSDANLGADYVQVGQTGATVDATNRASLHITGTGTQGFDNVLMIGSSEGEVNIDTGLVVTLNGKLDENPDNSGRDLVKTGGGTLILASLENEAGLSGDIFVNDGDVQVADDNSIPAGQIYLAEGKEMEFTGDGATDVNNPVNLTGDANINVASADKVVTISGAIQGNAGNDLTLKGAGKLILSGNSTFAGATKVDSGTFILNGSMANTANVTVAGKLGGSGSIGTEGSNGAVTVSNGGTLAAGNSPGILTLNNGLTLNAGAKLEAEINSNVVGTGYDQIVVKGSVNLTGATLVVKPALNLADGQTFTIISNDGVDAVVGTFAGIPNNGTVSSANGKYFTVKYDAGDGNDVVLTSYTPADPLPPTKATTTTVDGTTVQTTTTTGTGGTTTTTQTVAPVTTTRPEDPHTPNAGLADIPLATDSSGAPTVQVSLPVGVGLTSESTSGANLTLREQLIGASTTRVTDTSQMAQIIAEGIDQYVPSVTDQSQVTVRTVTLTAATSTAPTQPIVITGATGTGEADANHPLRQEALVIDARNLPPGTVLNLDKVEFAIIIGPSTVTGGAGRNYVIGDGSPQTIILGPEDDILHGGAGNDTVGSKGGNDQLFGDEGNDWVVGGIGNDSLYGGDGNDILQGGASDAGTWHFKLNAQGQLNVSFAPTCTELADSTGFSVTGNWAAPAGTHGSGPITDSRFAWVYDDYAVAKDAALLVQALAGRLPTLAELGTLANGSLSSQQLATMANAYFASVSGTQNASMEAQLQAVITQVWGGNAATPDLIQVGKTYLASGGNWADIWLALARHSTNSSKITDAQGNVSLIDQRLSDTGWSANSGDDSLNGGAGNDVLIGGGGNDTLDGGTGTDMAVWLGAIADYQVALTPSTAQGAAAGAHDALVRNKLTGEVDTVRNVELIKVGSMTYTLPSGQTQLADGVFVELASYVQPATAVQLAGVGFHAEWIV